MPANEVQQVQDWCKKYYALLGTPDKVGDLKTNQEVYERDADIRKEVLKMYAP